MRVSVVHAIRNWLPVALLAACTSTTAPAWSPAPGIWNLTTVNGAPLPATVTQGNTLRIVARQFVLVAGLPGEWADSTLIMNCGGPGFICNFGGRGQETWMMSGEVLMLVTVAGSNVGHVASSMIFAHQADGSLVRTEDGYTERYVRQ